MQSFSSPLHLEQGLGGLTRALSPTPVHVTYCATNALPFRVEWQSPRGPVMFYGLSPDEAAEQARGAIAKGSVPGPAHAVPVTDPIGASPYAEAMRDLIADIDERRRSMQRPVLRVVRGARSERPANG